MSCAGIWPVVSYWNASCEVVDVPWPAGRMLRNVPLSVVGIGAACAAPVAKAASITTRTTAGTRLMRDSLSYARWRRGMLSDEHLLRDRRDQALVRLRVDEEEIRARRSDRAVGRRRERERITGSGHDPQYDLPLVAVREVRER